MLNAFGFMIKFALFSVLVLILGNALHWNGRTLSDQIKIGMSHAERSHILSDVRDWAEEVTYDARRGIQKRGNHNTKVSSNEEEITSSERQKLKALIRELNSSRKQD